MSKIIKCAFTPHEMPTDGTPKFTIKPRSVHISTDFTELDDTKHKHEPPSPEVIAALLIEEAKSQAKKIIEDANAQSLAYMKATSEKVDAEFKLNMEKGYEQGFQKGVLDGKDKGYRDGYEVGLNEADKLYDKNIKFMQGIIEGIDDAKHMMLKKYESDLSNVAYEMAKMIIKAELEAKPEAINSIIEHAASTCKNQEFILVTLSQFAYDLVTNNKDSVAKTLKTYSDDVRFFVDASMNDTDCIIETPLGVIDASVAVQLENIKVAISDDDNLGN